MFDPLAGDPLRPDDWTEFIGQKPLVDRIIKNIDAAVEDMRAPSHTLFMAEPGTGKTTLARLIARRLGMPIEVFTCPVDFKVVQRLLVQDQFQGILFLDEIHRLSKREQEDYLTLLHDNYIEFRGEKFQVGWLMVIGATTDKKEIIPTMRDRFPFKPEFDPYTLDDIAAIVQSMARRLDFEVDDETAAAVAGAANGTPRHARDFVLAARDLRILNKREPTAEEILDHLRIEADGLGIEHFKYLEALQKLGSKAGMAPIAAMLNEDPKVVFETEKILIDKGLIRLTERGREMRTAAFDRLRDRDDATEQKETDDED